MSELRYLQDLSSEELKALYKKNNGFKNFTREEVR